MNNKCALPTSTCMGLSLSQPSDAAHPSGNNFQNSKNLITQLELGTHVNNLIKSQREPNSSSTLRGGRRPRSHNYSSSDVTTLLNIIEGHKPIGSSRWATVAEKYGEDAIDNSRPLQDQEALKSKFYKVVNVTMPTGGSSTPESVRRAKRLARSILCKVYTTSVEDKSIKPTLIRRLVCWPSPKVSKNSRYLGKWIEK